MTNGPKLLDEIINKGCHGVHKSSKGNELASLLTRRCGECYSAKHSRLLVVVSLLWADGKLVCLLLLDCIPQ